MPGLINAVQFLTILPIKNMAGADTKKLGASSLYFPVVGALLGLFLAALDKFLYPVLPAFLVNVILIFALIIVTGGMHIDGLADSCDALFCGREKEGILSIMREVHLGTFGILGIVGIVLFKLALLFSIPQELRQISLILMALLSRYSMSAAVILFPYARDEGKAKAFFENKAIKDFFFPTLITLTISVLIFKMYGLAVFSLVLGYTFLLGCWLKRKIGGMTGDTLGALSETSEALVLFTMVILSKFYF